MAVPTIDDILKTIQKSGGDLSTGQSQGQQRFLNSIGNIPNTAKNHIAEEIETNTALLAASSSDQEIDSVIGNLRNLQSKSKLFGGMTDATVDAIGMIENEAIKKKNVGLEYRNAYKAMEDMSSRTNYIQGSFRDEAGNIIETSEDLSTIPFFDEIQDWTQIPEHVMRIKGSDGSNRYATVMNWFSEEYNRIGRAYYALSAGNKMGFSGQNPVKDAELFRKVQTYYGQLEYAMRELLNDGAITEQEAGAIMSADVAMTETGIKANNAWFQQLQRDKIAFHSQQVNKSNNRVNKLTDIIYDLEKNAIKAGGVFDQEILNTLEDSDISLSGVTDMNGFFEGNANVALTQLINKIKKKIELERAQVTRHQSNFNKWSPIPLDADIKDTNIESAAKDLIGNNINTNAPNIVFNDASKAQKDAIINSSIRNIKSAVGLQGASNETILNYLIEFGKNAGEDYENIPEEQLQYLFNASSPSEVDSRFYGITKSLRDNTLDDSMPDSDIFTLAGPWTENMKGIQGEDADAISFPSWANTRYGIDNLKVDATKDIDVERIKQLLVEYEDEMKGLGFETYYMVDGFDSASKRTRNIDLKDYTQDIIQTKEKKTYYAKGEHPYRMYWPGGYETETIDDSSYFKDSVEFQNLDWIVATKSKNQQAKTDKTMTENVNQNRLDYNLKAKIREEHEQSFQNLSKEDKLLSTFNTRSAKLYRITTGSNVNLYKTINSSDNPEQMLQQVADGLAKSFFPFSDTKGQGGHLSDNEREKYIKDFIQEYKELYNKFYSGKGAKRRKALNNPSLRSINKKQLLPLHEILMKSKYYENRDPQSFKTALSLGGFESINKGYGGQ